MDGDRNGRSNDSRFAVHACVFCATSSNGIVAVVKQAFVICAARSALSVGTVNMAQGVVPAKIPSDILETD